MGGMGNTKCRVVLARRFRFHGWLRLPEDHERRGTAALAVPPSPTLSASLDRESFGLPIVLTVLTVLGCRLLGDCA